METEARQHALTAPPGAVEVPQALQRSIEDFLYYEAELLADRDYDAWLELFTDDVRYEVPVRVTREKKAEWQISPRARIFDDSKEMLEVRILRLKSEYAWAEDPPSRVRYFLSNIRVHPGETAEEYRVRYNVLIYRSRGELPRYELLSGERRDVLRRTTDGWKIAHRVVVLDQSVLGTYNLSYFV